MTTFNLVRGTAAPIQPAAHKNNHLDVISFVVDAKLMASKPTPQVVLAADIVEGPKFPANFAPIALMWQVTRVAGSATTATIEWDDGTDIVTGFDCNALGKAVVMLTESAADTYATPAVSVAADKHVQLLAVANLENARIKVQIAGIWFMEDETTPMLQMIV